MRQIIKDMLAKETKEAKSASLSKTPETTLDRHGLFCSLTQCSCVNLKFRIHYQE